ncbi:hypothetical protein DFH09DRAFT_235783 [Mycena vulgaris]|nr:hypothetical protein DFH09DRAFT_235783 [Mycena vulgaris]
MLANASTHQFAGGAADRATHRRGSDGSAPASRSRITRVPCGRSMPPTSLRRRFFSSFARCPPTSILVCNSASAVAMPVGLWLRPRSLTPLLQRYGAPRSVRRRSSSLESSATAQLIPRDGAPHVAVQCVCATALFAFGGANAKASCPSCPLDAYESPVAQRRSSSMLLLLLRATAPSAHPDHPSFTYRSHIFFPPTYLFIFPCILFRAFPKDLL